MSLKPCPFCGSTDLTFDPDTSCIICDSCGGFGPNPDKEVGDNLETTDEQMQEHAAAKWNKRAPEPPAIPCEFPGCPNPADYEGWFRRRDPFLGTPTGHIVRIAFCESCKKHPHLCANEPKPTKDSQPKGDVPSPLQGTETK